MAVEVNSGPKKRVHMPDIEREEILKSPELVSLLEQVNKEAEKLNMVFLVTPTITANGSGLEIVWQDKILPKEVAKDIEWNTSKKNNAANLWLPTYKDDIMGALHLIRNIVATAAGRAPVDKEDDAVMIARRLANKIFIWLGAVCLVFLGAALWSYFNADRPHLANLMLVSVSAVMVAWCSNEWR